MSKKHKKPRILFVDIETAPILARVWDLRDQNVGLNQIKKDWFILSWAAKWRGGSKMMYADAKRGYTKQNDKKLLGRLWKLLDEADIVVAQNGKRFDIPKINARFIQNGFERPSHYRVIDTCEQARRIFGFTSNSLAYLAKTLLGEEKGEHKRFPGMDLWTACMEGNPLAWQDMQEYNKKDVALLERLFERILPWDNSINFDVYQAGRPKECRCGGTQFVSRGYYYSGVSKYQCYRCKACGAQSRSPVNEISREEQKKMARPIR